VLIQDVSPYLHHPATISRYRGRPLAYYRYPTKYHFYQQRYKWPPWHNKYKVTVHAHSNKRPPKLPHIGSSNKLESKKPNKSKPKKKPSSSCIAFQGVCNQGKKCCGGLKCQARTPGGRWRYNGKKSQVCRYY